MLTGTPLDLTPFGPLLSALGLLYWAVALGAAGLALWLPRAWWVKLSTAALVAAAFVYPVVSHLHTRQTQRDERQARLDESMALFRERCKGAGEKITRTVDNVDGVFLENIRPKMDSSDRSDPNWPDAALPDESRGEWYIRTFLFWEHHEDKRNPRGYLNNQFSDSPGYQFVDVKDTDGIVYRYRLIKSELAQLSRELVNGSPARYAISFINIVDPTDRKKWIAGTKVFITDTATNEIIAEHTWFSIEPGQGNISDFRSPWGFVQTCPPLKGGNTPTRFFVDRVLKPKKE